MNPAEAFFKALDAAWRRPRPGKIPLKVLGSAALMLQTDYSRATKDGDVLETDALPSALKAELLGLAGKGTAFAARHGMYLEFVLDAILFRPQRPRYRPVAALAGLRHLSVEAMAIVDVAVTKLARFKADDVRDIGAMIGSGMLRRAELVERFKLAVDLHSTDARAADLPRFVKNLHTVERELFDSPETEIELPDWA